MSERMLGPEGGRLCDLTSVGEKNETLTFASKEIQKISSTQPTARLHVKLKF